MPAADAFVTNAFQLAFALGLVLATGRAALADIGVIVPADLHEGTGSLDG